MRSTTVGGNRYADKRRAVRARVQLSARYVSESLTLEGHVTDVSADGLFFASDFLDDEGEVARLWIVVPSRERPLELRGEVRWVSDAAATAGMGLRLIDVSLEDRLLLSSLGSSEADLSAAAPPGTA